MVVRRRQRWWRVSEGSERERKPKRKERDRGSGSLEWVPAKESGHRRHRWRWVAQEVGADEESDDWNTWWTVIVAGELE